MVRSPNDGARLELARFVRPDSVPGSPAATANELGSRNVAFEADTYRRLSIGAATGGYGLAGGVGEYVGACRMAYIRGRRGRSLAGRAHRLMRNICRVERPTLPRRHLPKFVERPGDWPRQECWMPHQLWLVAREPPGNVD